jgi:flagellar hook-associated protein 1 FlgK
VVDQKAIDAVPGVPTIFTRPITAGGVDVSATQRMSDPVLAARMRTETARGALADSSAATLSQIEDVFPEPSDTGLTEQLNDYWNSWASVANDPGATAARTVLLQRATTVAATLNSMSTSLGNVAASTRLSLTNDVSTANSAASELATLNGQIAVATGSNQNANALLDRRDVLLNQLSSLVGAVATIRPDGGADVSVAGSSLVSGVTVSTLSANPDDSVAVNGTSVPLGGGSVAAAVTVLTTTLPSVQSRLDAVADALRTASNTAQAAGYDLSGAAGQPLFSGSGAAGITVALTNPTAIAAASTSGAALDGNNALAAGGLGSAAGSADKLYAALVSDTGASSALAKQQQATQQSVTAGVGALLTSVTGVSTDEEVTNMLTYQRGYQAASRVLTTLDDMLDTLINHTGVVGRA